MESHMETTNILCEKKEQLALNTLFDDIKNLLQDSDVLEEKESVKNSLRKMSDTTTYIILGNEQSGKTSLLNAIFQDMASFLDDFQGEMCEYRWGEQEVMTPVKDGAQKKFVTSENMRGISVIDTKGINRIGTDMKVKIKEQIEKSSAVFVVFDVNSLRSPKLWDIIEGCPEKRMIFFLTKCDLVSEEELENSVKKIKKYMQESKIAAPIFPISAVKKDILLHGMTTLDDVRIHIKNHVIGKNPTLTKQMENIEEMKQIVVQLKDSFSLRKQQYTSDREILQKINQSLDGYMINHKQFLDGFLSKVAAEINKDIDAYEHEIISKLDPYKIKERFQKREDFETYLNMVNDNYKGMMNDSINRKAIEAIKSCLHDLEIVFQEAVGYFNKRENILALNDKFYGTLSNSRKQMVNETKEVVLSTGELYHTLTEASETLFLQIWDERKKYDAKIRSRKVLSTISGGSTLGALGAVGGVAVGNVAGTALTAALTTFGASAAEAATLGMAAGSMLGAIAVVGLVGIGVIVGAAVVNKIAKSLYDPKAADKMEKNVEKCIEQFKTEVNNTRIKMVEQVSAQITTIFENELTSVDNCFMEFRMSVNIDEKKIPVLEQRLLETEDLLKKIDSI